MTANRSYSSKALRRIIKLPACIFLVAALVVTGASFVYAQKKKTKTKPKAEKLDKNSLQKKKASLQADIDLTDKLLKQTRRSKTLSLSQLVALNQKISAREALINEIGSEVNDISREITDDNSSIERLDTEVAQLKRDYANMIVFAYRNRNPYERMMFIFSSSDFNQAYLRMRYMQQVGEDRKIHAQEIGDTLLALNENKRDLEEQLAEKEALLDSQETEHHALAAEKDDKDKTFRDLQSKESQLKEDLDKKKKEKSDIDAAIQKMIADEAARAAASAAKSSSGNNSKSKNNDVPASKDAPPKLVLTPEAESLGNSFAGNQGALPWPVQQGSIISHFGKHEHPVLQGVMVNNNGIDIATTTDADARAVFDGEVTGVTNIAGSGWLVIVRHGEYLTVYAKLESVNVKQGDKVKTKQAIGKVSEDPDENQTVLHFEVWKSGVGKMDPEQWLMKSAH
ncbi:MAG: peptidoglycan DD-metalloendopeptidase family protein [Bacteroidetes bacterium]|nr:peptidoglycan DD-metalloendopeptidase family protein [Bacteroidota bacterium]